MSQLDWRAGLGHEEQWGVDARHDQHLSSAALVMSGLVLLVGEVLEAAFPDVPSMPEPFYGWTYWTGALPIGFLGLAAWLQFQRLRTGQGAWAVPWVSAAVGISLGLLVYFPYLFTPLFLVAGGVALIVVAIAQRKLVPAGWGVGLLLLIPLSLRLALVFWYPAVPLGLGVLVLALCRREAWLATVAAAFSGFALLTSFGLL